MKLNRRSWPLLLVGILILATIPTAQSAEANAKSIPITKIKHSGPVDFEREVLPILRNNCLACHNQTKPKGGLVLETPQTILKGGDSGAAVVPKKPVESLLLKAASHQDPELIMPPPDNKVAAMPLKPEELGLVQLWIEQGAKGEVRASAPVVWQSIPPGLNAIYAVALTRDGQFAACGRANQIFIYHLPTGRLAARLNDPQLQKASNSGAAHRDTVNSLSFSPNGELLASGGYREVKLWRHAVTNETLRVLTNSEFAGMSKERKWIAASLTNGELRSLETNERVLRTNVSLKSITELTGDPRVRFVVGEKERELTFAKSEIDYRKSALKAAETNQVAAVARQKKATETNTALAKIAGEKQTALTNAVNAQKETEQAFDDLGPEIKNLLEAVTAAEKEFTNAVALAKAAKDGTDKARAEKLATDADTKSNLLAEAKLALDKLPSETKTKQKQASEKLNAANKSVIDAEKDFKKAEQTRLTAEHELQLAEAAVRKTDTAATAAKTELANAETEAERAAKALESAKQTLTETEKAISVVAFSPEDSALVTVDDGGSIRFWSAETGTPFDQNWNSSWKVGSSRVDLQACKLEYSIVSPK